LYATPNIWNIRSSRMGLGGKWHIEMHTDFWWGNPKETDHVARLGRDVRRILKWILQKQNGWV